MARQIIYCQMTQDRLHETKECVERALPYVDHVVIVDGGSIDDSVFYFRNWSQDEPKLHFYIHPWADNFSGQRNNYLRRAEKFLQPGDYVLVSDPDEWFEENTFKNLHRVADFLDQSQYNVAGFQCRSISLKGPQKVWESVDDYWKHLFYRWEKGMHYVGNPHETMVMPSGFRMVNTPFMYEHVKQQDVIWARGCFVEGTRIITNRGYIPIEKVKVGDSVLDVNGDLKLVEDTMSRYVDEEIMVIKRYGAPALKITKEHPVWTSIAKGCGVDSKAVRYRPFMKQSHESKGCACCQDPNFYYEHFGWTDAADLNERHIMHFPALKKLSRASIPPLKIRNGGNQYRSKFKYVEITPDLCRLIGYYLSEGSLDLKQGVVDLSFSIYERDTLVEDLQQIVVSELDRSLTLKTPVGNCQKVKFNSVDFVQWLDRIFSHKSWNKRIPLSFIAALSDDEKAELIKGIFLGDGTKNDYNYTLTLTSPHVVMSCWLMLVGFGIRAGLSKIGLNTLNNSLVDKENAIMHKRPMYRVRIPRADVEIFEDEVLFRNKPYFDMHGRKKARPSKTFVGQKSVSAWFTPGQQSVQSCLTDISIDRYRGKVYNLEVSDTETYCLPYISVHNCRNMFVGGGGPNLGTSNKFWLELKSIVKEVYGKDLSWHEFEDEMLKGNLDRRVKEWMMRMRLEDGWDGASEHREAYKYYFRILHPEEEPEELKGTPIP